MSRNELFDRIATLIAAVAAGGLVACGGDSHGSPPDGPLGGDLTAAQVRDFIGTQIPGGIDKLKVPATDSAIPVPGAPQGFPGRFDTTEAKRYLGKQLFHDPNR